MTEFNNPSNGILPPTGGGNFNQSQSPVSIQQPAIVQTPALDPATNFGATNPQGDIILVPDVPPKKKISPRLIAIIAGVVVLILIFVLSVVFGNSNNSTQESTDTATVEPSDSAKLYFELKEFKTAYVELVDSYSAVIGYTPALTIVEEGDGILLWFPVDSSAILEFKDDIKTVETEVDNLKEKNTESLSSDQLQDFSQILNDTIDVLYIMGKNISQISEFYDAFIEPIENYRQSIADWPASCIQSDEMGNLMNSDDENIRNIAGQYYNLYCQTINLYWQQVDDETATSQIRELSVPAAEALNSVLISIDEGKISTNDIINLISELE